MQHIALNAEAIDGVLAGDDAAPIPGARLAGEIGTTMLRVCLLRHDAEQNRSSWANG